MCKGFRNLIVEVLAVGNDDHTRMNRPQFHEDILRQHHHSQRLAAALCVPDDAALPVALFVVGIDRADDLPNREKLLMPADFLDIRVIQHEIFGQLHEPVRVQQRDNISVLRRVRTLRDICIEQTVAPCRIFLAPDIPEFLCRAGGRVFHEVLVCRKDDLRELEKLRRILRLLVADYLRDRLLD